MEITQDKINAAYAVADESQKKVLDALFGKQKQPHVKDNRPITERIKTFEDALEELSVKNYVGFHAYPNNEEDFCEQFGDCPEDVYAYLKLRVIVVVLNEGWMPEFVKGECRYAPWFSLFTNKELTEMDDDGRSKITPCRVVGRSYSSASASGGLAYASAGSASSVSNPGHGSRLAFKTYELAEYAGQQFIDIYAAMMGLEVTGEAAE